MSTVPSPSSRAVFLSYASQDAAAVARIAEALRANGVEVWFDRDELVGGDAWDAKIRGQIATCALFVPVISAATQARLEGYFRIEWKLAARRTHAMATAKAFLLPVVIDDTRDGEAHVPDEFREVQWTRLPGGETNAAFCARVKKLLGGAGTPIVAGVVEAGPAPAGPVATKPFRRWLGPAILGGAAVAALAFWQPWRAKEESAPKASPSAAVASSVPSTEAQRLVAKARKILDEGDEMNRETYTLAEELLKKAEAIDVTEAAAWSLHAQLSSYMFQFGFDRSLARKDAVRSQADRAAQLAPGSVEAEVAQAAAGYVTGTDRPGDQQRLLALPKTARNDGRVLRELARSYAVDQKTDQALATLQQAIQLSPDDPRLTADLVNSLWTTNRIAEADQTAELALSRHPSARLWAFSLLFKLIWRGDPAGASAAVQSGPTWFLAEDRGCAIAALAFLWNREPEKALMLLDRFPRDYLRSSFFVGPRAVLTAWAHEESGHAESARADWRIVVQLSDRELRADPADVPALHWKAWALARLGETAEAARVLQLLEERNARVAVAVATDSLFGLLGALALTVGQPERALAHIARVQANGDRAVTKAILRLNPVFASLRSDPRFQALIASALGPEEKKENVPVGATAPDPKSVAVLAFANLSDDRGNEYFSDGISEELLNVLAKVPELKVTARTSAFSFKGKDTPIPEIAKQLGVAYVVEGSVRRSGEKVRITAQLIKAADGFHVWSDTFTRELRDVFAVQDEIAGLIAQNLRAKMAAFRERPAPAPDVYALLLQARHAAADQTNDGARRAIALYQQAVARDPKCVEAWAESALNYVQLGRFGGLPTAEGMREARIAARRALELDAEHPLGWLALAWVQRTNDRDWRGAIASFRRALGAAPENVTIMSDASICFLNVGYIDEAEALAAQAVARDPLNARSQWSLGAIYLWSGRPALAVDAYRRASELAPTGDEYHSHLARALAIAGRFPEALQEAQLEPNERYRLVAMATLQYHSGDRAAGDRTLQEIIDKYGDTMAGYLANLCAAAGRTDDVFRWLERGYETRDAAMAWIKTNAAYRSVTSDPRWAQFLRKMGLADDQLK